MRKLQTGNKDSLIRQIMDNVAEFSDATKIKKEPLIKQGDIDISCRTECYSA